MNPALIRLDGSAATKVEAALPPMLLGIMRNATANIAVVGGGFIRDILRNYTPTDIDYFVANANYFFGNKNIPEIAANLANIKRRLRGATIGEFAIKDYPYYIQQIQTPDPIAAVVTFDFTVNRVLFGYEEGAAVVYADPEFEADLAARRLNYGKPGQKIQPINSLRRLTKMLGRGFTANPQLIATTLAMALAGTRFAVDHFLDQEELLEAITAVCVPPAVKTSKWAELLPSAPLQPLDFAEIAPDAAYLERPVNAVPVPTAPPTAAPAEEPETQIAAAPQPPDMTPQRGRPRYIPTAQPPEMPRITEPFNMDWLRVPARAEIREDMQRRAREIYEAQNAAIQAQMGAGAVPTIADRLRQAARPNFRTNFAQDYERATRIGAALNDNPRA